MPATSSVDPKPFAAPPGIVESRPFAAPPPSVMFPPVELHVLEDQPEQMELESPSLIPPPLVASVSDQIVKGPPIVRRFTLAEVRTLRFDFKISSSPTPEIVMLAPAVKSLVAPVADSEVDPPEVIAAPVLIEEHWMLMLAPAAIVPEELLLKDPESQPT
jgi:hypothetical protein